MAKSQKAYSKQIINKGPFKYYVSMFWGISNPPTLCVLLVSKKGQFLNPPTQSNTYIIFEWSLASLLSIYFFAYFRQIGEHWFGLWLILTTMGQHWKYLLKINCLYIKKEFFCLFWGTGNHYLVPDKFWWRFLILFFKKYFKDQQIIYFWPFYCQRLLWMPLMKKIFLTGNPYQIFMSSVFLHKATKCYAII